MSSQLPLLEKSDPMLSGKWSKYGHKNGTYFIEEAYTEGIILEKTLFQENSSQLYT